MSARLMILSGMVNHLPLNEWGFNIWHLSRIERELVVVIQLCILVSKLKKTKTMFPSYTGYLKSIKKTIKQDLLLILVLVRQQNLVNC